MTPEEHESSAAVVPTSDGVAGPLQVLELLGSMAVIFVLDLLAGLEIEFATVFSSGVAHALDWLEVAGGVAFVLVAIAAVFAGIRRDERMLLRLFMVYLTVATVHVLGNIAALLVTAHVRDNDYLWGVWDVGAAYMMIVAVFTGWYWVCDRILGGTAFDFSVKRGRTSNEPRLIDYLFIAFNTNATFGPPETVLSRRVKLLMMLQTMCSLIILLVLVARVVGLREG